MDFRCITPCGECCEGCKKKEQGMCRGCLETGGHCEEWAGSGVCPTFSCAKNHGAVFCGVCPEFPCDHLPMIKWRPDCVRELTELAKEYRAGKACLRLYCLELGYDTDKRREGFHIGMFASLKEAKEVGLRYRSEVMGFTRPDITEEITEVPLLDASELPCCVYRWQGYDVDDKLDEYNIVESPCYADESAAQAALVQAQRDTPRQEWVLNRHVIGQCDWQEGFDSCTWTSFKENTTMNMNQIKQNAINWALAREGKAEYVGWCLSFIEDAVEKSNGIELFGGDCARKSALMYADGLRFDEPEPGAFVFYDCCGVVDGEMYDWGHCGLCIGDGQVIHAWDKVRVDDYRALEQLSPIADWTAPHYIGWVPLERVLAQKP